MSLIPRPLAAGQFIYGKAILPIARLDISTYASNVVARHRIFPDSLFLQIQRGSPAVSPIKLGVHPAMGRTGFRLGDITLFRSCLECEKHLFL
jgi:hypothetical protein